MITFIIEICFDMKYGEYEEDWSDKIEPWTNGIGLASDAIGIGTAATGIGVPVGAIIAGVGNIPNIIVDGYQTVRDWKRVYDGDYNQTGNALWNTAETALDLLGAKFIKKGFKYSADKQFTDEIKGRIQDEVKRRQKNAFILRKKGMSDSDIAKYITNKATNAAINARDINQRRRERNKKYDKRALITAYLTNTAQNTYHIIPNDATRVNKPIIVDKYVRK